MTATSTVKRLWKNEYFQTALTVVLIVAVVTGSWFGSRFVLNTDYPALAVASGSMCTLPGPYCDGWSHPFTATLHVGDLIVVQGVKPEEINAAPYPKGDIIVYRRGSDDLIVHRAINKTTSGGTLYFVTRGDGNLMSDAPVPADQVIGKVILRVPWIGHLSLLMRNSSGLWVVITLIIIVLVVEVVLPLFKRKGTQQTKETTEETKDPKAETTPPP